jgi:hypothetical protein
MKKKVLLLIVALVGFLAIISSDAYSTEAGGHLIKCGDYEIYRCMAICKPCARYCYAPAFVNGPGRILSCPNCGSAEDEDEDFLGMEYEIE